MRPEESGRRGVSRRAALALFGGALSAAAGCSGGSESATTGETTRTTTARGTTRTPTARATTTAATTAADEPAFASSFPSYRDPETGLRVYQVTSHDAAPDRDGNETGYYHYDPLYGNWVVTRTITDGGQRYFKTDVKTGERVPLAGWNEMAGMQVRGSTLFTTRPTADGPHLAALDLDAMAWTTYDFGTEGEPWHLSGALAVDPDGRRVVSRERAAGESGSRYRTRAFDVDTGERRVLYEGESYRDHHEFSPTADGFYRFINEWTGEGAPFRFQTARFGVGHVERGGEPLELAGEFWTADADDEGPHGAGYNLGHPFWGVDGRCHSDVAWHPDLPFGEFELVTVDFPSVADPFAPIAERHQTRRRYPGRYWSHHFNDAGPDRPDWFVGDGDVIGLYTPGESVPRTFTNAFRLLDDGDMVYVPLAEVPAPLHDSRTHLLPSGEGVVTVWAENLLEGSDARLNVFLIALPDTVRAAMDGDESALADLLDAGRATRVANRLDRGRDPTV